MPGSRRPLGALDTALGLLSGDALAELEARADTLRLRHPDARRTCPPTRVQRIHGDLHVGQVLSSAQGLAVIDLDDDISIDVAERGRPLPAARDVAQMTCSLDHVGRIAARRTAAASTHRHRALDRWRPTGLPCCLSRTRWRMRGTRSCSTSDC